MQLVSCSISDDVTGSSQRCPTESKVVILFVVPPCQLLRAGPRISFHTSGNQTSYSIHCLCMTWILHEVQLEPPLCSRSQFLSLKPLSVLRLIFITILKYLCLLLSHLIPSTVNKVKPCFPEALGAIYFSVIIWGYYRGKYNFVLLPRDNVDVLILAV